MHGSNLAAMYNKVIPMEMFPTDYLPDDYTGPSPGSVDDIVGKIFT